MYGTRFPFSLMLSLSKHGDEASPGAAFSIRKADTIASHPECASTSTRVSL